MEDVVFLNMVISMAVELESQVSERIEIPMPLAITMPITAVCLQTVAMNLEV